MKKIYFSVFLIFNLLCFRQVYAAFQSMQMESIWQEPESLAPETTIITRNGQKYIIEGIIGAGGFGMVYKVKDQNQNQLALKVSNKGSNLSKEIIPKGEFIMPATVQKADFYFKDKSPFSINQYVEVMPLGIPLVNLFVNTDYVDRINSIYFVLKDITQAILEINEQGLVHNDIKPENIILYNKKFVLTDFGLVNYEFHPAKGRTKYYASSEQLSENITTMYSDFYSLAISLMDILEAPQFLLKDSKATRFSNEQWYQILSKEENLSPSAQNKLKVISQFLRQATIKDPNLREEALNKGYLENMPIKRPLCSSLFAS